MEETLKDIKAIDKPIFVVFNKIDAYRYEEYDEFSLEPKRQENYTLEEFKNSWIAKENTPCIFISAREKMGIDKLRGDRGGSGKLNSLGCGLNIGHYYSPTFRSDCQKKRETGFQTFSDSLCAAGSIHDSPCR